jgi:hypothetical protein
MATNDDLPPAIEVDDLVKRFGDTEAVDGLSFTSPRGDPRRARPQRCRQDHHDQRARDAAASRRRHGARRRPRRHDRRSPRPAGDLDDRPVRGRRRPAQRPGEPPAVRPAPRARRGDAGAARRRAARDVRARRRRGRGSASYSGGMRRRLDIACSLTSNPRSCSSTNRPPGSTRAAATICGTSCGACVPTGMTIVLTTQYLEEADQLADHRRHRPGSQHRRRHPGRAQAGAGGATCSIAGRRRGHRRRRRGRRPAPRRDTSTPTRSGSRSPPPTAVETLTPRCRGAARPLDRHRTTPGCAPRRSTRCSWRSPAVPDDAG